jgi:hypothetical protein
VEPNRVIIEDLMRRYGYAENEAEVAYHLERAQDLLAEMHEESFASGAVALPGLRASMFRVAFVEPHFRALFALLNRRVLERDYPERLGPSPDLD